MVVATCGRPDSLRAGLEALSQLDYGAFEVIVVTAPADQRTESVLGDFSGRIKVGRCPGRNAAQARNIGLALAAGEYVALIDDDAYPEPDWLDCLVAGFDSDQVAAAGGPVLDHTGRRLQTRYNVATRFGQELKAEFKRDHWLSVGNNPSLVIGGPLSRAFVYAIGTNAMFRRDRLVEIGGFDEEFDWNLEETEVCLRLGDRGYLVRALERGLVHHKLLASHLRGDNRALRDRYSHLKNQVYFALRHALPVASFYEVCEQLLREVEGSRRDYHAQVEAGRLTAGDERRFERDVHRAFDDGLRRFVAGVVRTRDGRWFEARRQPFLPFPTRRPAAAKLHLCILCIGETDQGSPAGRRLAAQLAADGHLVRILTGGAGTGSLELERGVWVHRGGGLWEELERVHEQRPVDVAHVQLGPSGAGSDVLRGSLASGFRVVAGLDPPLTAPPAPLRAGCEQAGAVLALSTIPEPEWGLAANLCYDRLLGRATARTPMSLPPAPLVSE